MDNFELYRESLLKEVEKAWKDDTMGKNKCAYKGYKGGSIFFMLHQLAQLIRLSMDRGDCDLTRFKLPCVESNLACLSKTYGTDYVNVWKGLKKTYDIEECCNSGIETMIIEETNCDTFKIR